MKLPDLPEYARGPTIDGVRYKPPSLSTTQLRAIQREAAIWALEEAEKGCIEQSTAAYKRWRDERDVYDDGGCDMATALAADILKLKEKIE